MSASRQFAIVTGACSGIGRELAKVCAREGFDLLIAADEPEIETAAVAQIIPAGFLAREHRTYAEPGSARS
jgi:NAD(P)-dependent dehydrogenase (short-subunit alcohol dehydrogenase family)